MTRNFSMTRLTADSIRGMSYPEQNIAIFKKIPYKIANTTLIYRIATNDVGIKN